MNTKKQELRQLLKTFRTYAALDFAITFTYERNEEPSQEMLDRFAGLFSLPMSILKNYDLDAYAKYNQTGVEDNEICVFVDAIECLI